MEYPKLRAVSQAPIIGLIENLPVTSNGWFMSDEQMANVEAALAASETAAADLVIANESLAAQTGEITRLTGELSTTKGLLTTAEAEVVRLGALAGTASGTIKTEDEFEATTKDPMSFDFQQAILKRFE